MKGRGVLCCKCGTVFNRSTWRKDGVIGCSVNGGRQHYACKPCSDAGFDLIKHAAEKTLPCSIAKEKEPAA